MLSTFPGLSSHFSLCALKVRCACPGRLPVFLSVLLVFVLRRLVIVSNTSPRLFSSTLAQPSLHLRSQTFVRLLTVLCSVQVAIIYNVLPM